MRYGWMIFVLGIISIIIPWSGLPLNGKKALMVLVGVCLVALAILYREELKAIRRLSDNIKKYNTKGSFQSVEMTEPLVIDESSDNKFSYNEREISQDEISEGIQAAENAWQDSEDVKRLIAEEMEIPSEPFLREFVRDDEYAVPQTDEKLESYQSPYAPLEEEKPKKRGRKRISIE